MKRFRLSTLLLLIAVCAVMLAWWRDHRHLAAKLELSRAAIDALRREPQEDLRFTGKPVARPNRFETAGEFVAALRKARDWRQFMDDIAQPYTKTALAHEAIPALLQLLKDRQPEVRRRAVAALGMIGRQADLVVPALIPLLNDSSPAVRSLAAYQIGRFGPDASMAVAYLAAQMHDGSSSIRVGAALAIRQIDPHVPVGPTLLELLSAADVETRRSAVATFIDCRWDAATEAAAVPRLLDCLQDDDALVREYAVSAVARLAPHEQATESIAKVYKDDPEAHVRSTAAGTLKRLLRASSARPASRTE